MILLSLLHMGVMNPEREDYVGHDVYIIKATTGV